MEDRLSSESARQLFLRALRFHPECPKLYQEVSVCEHKMRESCLSLVLWRRIYFIKLKSLRFMETRNKQGSCWGKGVTRVFLGQQQVLTLLIFQVFSERLELLPVHYHGEGQGTGPYLSLLECQGSAIFISLYVCMYVFIHSFIPLPFSCSPLPSPSCFFWLPLLFFPLSSHSLHLVFLRQIFPSPPGGLTPSQRGALEQ